MAYTIAHKNDCAVTAVCMHKVTIVMEVCWAWPTLLISLYLTFLELLTKSQERSVN